MTFPPPPPAADQPDPAPMVPLTARVRDYGDAAAEYAALRTGALLVDRSHRDRWTFRGPRAKEMLTGLVTNDVLALGPGQGQYAAALTPKGRIVADVRILALDDAAVSDGAAPAWTEGATLLVDVPARAAEGWGATIRKFLNPRVVPYRSEGERLRALGIYGVAARDALAAAFGAPVSALGALAPYAHATLTLGAHAMLVVRVPDLGLDGFELVLPAAAFDDAWARLSAVPGVAAGGELAHAIARVEAGYPEWGIDVDDTTIPQEANLDELRAISYTKGCYTGQEVVARVHFRGHVNRHLRGIAYPADGGLVPRGAQLLDETGKVVGDVRSSVLSPRLGGVGLAMVRREVALGATLVARWAPDGDAAAAAGEGLTSGERPVTVGPLPFPL